MQNVSLEMRTAGYKSLELRKEDENLEHSIKSRKYNRSFLIVKFWKK